MVRRTENSLKAELSTVENAVREVYESAERTAAEIKEKLVLVRDSKDFDSDSKEYEQARSKRDDLKSALKVGEKVIKTGWDKCADANPESDAYNKWLQFACDMEIATLKIEGTIDDISTALERAEERSERKDRYERMGHSSTGTRYGIENSSETIGHSVMRSEIPSLGQQGRDRPVSALESRGQSNVEFIEPRMATPTENNTAFRQSAGQNFSNQTNQIHQDSCRNTTAPYVQITRPLIQPRIPEWNAKVKTFDGRYEAWDAFWESFNAYIHSQPYDDMTKLQLLLDHCVGEAKEFIEAASDSGITYSAVLEIVKRHYDDDQIKKDAHVTKIRETKCAEMSSKSLNSNYFKLKAAIYGLQRYEEVDTAVMRTLIKEKFPRQIVQRIDRRERERRSPLTINRLFDEIRDAIDTCKREETYSEFADRTSQRSVTRNVSSECSLCGYNNHRTSDCKRFTDPAEVNKIVVEKDLCRRCLKTGHASKDCSESGCRICHGTHHAKLCRRSASGPENRNNQGYGSQNRNFRNRDQRNSGPWNNRQNSNYNGNSNNYQRNTQRFDSENHRDGQNRNNSQNWNRNDRPNFRNNERRQNEDQRGSQETYGRQPFRQ